MTQQQIDDVTPHYYVGIGASAGGLEALRGFVNKLADGLPATYIVAQHMSPQHRSMLVDIISRETELPVLDVTHGVAPKPNTIYITPPNSNCTYEDGLLRLTEPDSEISPKPSVDLLFQSLAEGCGDRAIAIVLSGTGSDGSRGVRAVHEAGGIVIAQDQVTAKYPSMPQASIKTDTVDLVMSPDELGETFRDILAAGGDLEPFKASPIHLDNISALVQLLFERTGVNFRHYKTATFRRRLERRISAVGMVHLDDYLGFIRDNPGEIDELYKDMLISVTSFFRDPEEFDDVSTYIDQLVEEAGDRQIRVWIVGCATGEEAYSLAILLLEALGGPSADVHRARLQIFATDLDEPAVAHARHGLYTHDAVAGLPVEYRDKYFEEETTGYRASKLIRDRIIFSVHDVASDPPFRNIDLVSCRNLLIYFETVLQAHVMNRFHYSLRDNGILFLGRTETTYAAESMFRQSQGKSRVYLQRPGVSERSAVARPLADRTPEGRVLGDEPGVFPPIEARELEVLRNRFDSLVKSLGGKALLVSHELAILQVFGNIAEYVQVSEGAITTSANSLLAEPYDQDVRVLVPTAIRKAVAMEGTIRSAPDDPKKRRRVVVYPVHDGQGYDINALVVFTEWTEDQTELSVVDSDGNSEAVARLYRDLAVSQRSLQQTVEVVETSNEELQALNEELQSTNEELQSTNEELETSNEELQSTNEELSTVNDELEDYSQQLHVANQSLKSILENVTIPMVVVDHTLHVTHLSSSSQDFFELTEVNDELLHLAQFKLPAGFPSLMELAERAIASGTRVSEYVETPSISAEISVVPHFASLDEIIGAIIVISDSSAAIEGRNTLLEAAARVARVGYLWTDLRSKKTIWSDVLYDILGLAGTDTVPDKDNNWGLDFLAADASAELRKGIKDLLADGSEFEATVPVMGGVANQVNVVIHLAPSRDDTGTVVGWIGVVTEASRSNPGNIVDVTGQDDLAPATDDAI